MQSFGTIARVDGSTTPVRSAEPPPGTDLAHRREIELAPEEFVTCVNAWLSDRHDGLIGSISITLSSCRVFRFGSSWAPGQQVSPCAPSFTEAIPPGSHVLGLFGERDPEAKNISGSLAPGGGLRRLGVAFATQPAAADSGGGIGTGGWQAPPRPYLAERDAVSLAFLRSFYDAHVRAADSDENGHKNTDWVARNVVMRETWDEASGRARRFAELLEPAQRWPGPESGKDMFFVSHGAGKRPRAVRPLSPAAVQLPALMLPCRCPLHAAARLLNLLTLRSMRSSSHPIASQSLPIISLRQPVPPRPRLS